jgi:hypothetical protein
MFNKYIITIKPNSTIHFIYKDQGKKIQLVNKKGDNLQQKYLKQRAYSIYIALIC